ncbi:MAG: Gfo/Idh/MocA family oxidoreductase [Ruminococcaceae bacterium]|nr:Gfo/Idh/MocA family oxidoreductase [Oscillospiraceae bacterium]
MALGIGIIGCGAISRLHIDAFRAIDGVEIRAVSDAVAEVAAKVGEQLNVEGYGDYKDLLKREDIDVVSICTPSGLHHDIAIDAAKAGKNIIVEKPLEVTTEKIDDIIHACKENGVKLACVFNNRYREGNLFIKKAIEAGRFGKLISANAFVQWYRAPEYYSKSNWRGTWAFDGGGTLMNQSIHYIDMLLWFAGPVKALTGYTATLLHEGIETEDTATAIFKFKSGALGTIICGTSCYPGFPARIELTGERGTAVICDGAITSWSFADEDPLDLEAAQYMAADVDNARASDPMAFDSTYHRIQFENILESFKAGRNAEVDGYEARKSVELIRSIYRSAELGKEVVLD